MVGQSNVFQRSVNTSPEFFRLTLSLQTMPFGGFPDYLSFAIFWPLPVVFRRKDQIH